MPYIARLLPLMDFIDPSLGNLSRAVKYSRTAGFQSIAQSKGPTLQNLTCVRFTDVVDQSYRLFRNWLLLMRYQNLLTEDALSRFVSTPACSLNYTFGDWISILRTFGYANQAKPRRESKALCRNPALYPTSPSLRGGRGENSS